jgi:aminoglycoside phosphotransferase family enzyme
LRSYLAFFPEAKIGSGWAHLLLWFKAYRANIRAKVNALRHAQQGSETTRNAVVLYLDLMAKYLRKLPAEG